MVQQDRKLHDTRKHRHWLLRCLESKVWKILCGKSIKVKKNDGVDVGM